jgi:hypothetical protein
MEFVLQKKSGTDSILVEATVRQMKPEPGTGSIIQI